MSNDKQTPMEEFIEYLELTYGSLNDFIKEIYLEKEKEAMKIDGNTSDADDNFNINELNDLLDKYRFHKSNQTPLMKDAELEKHLLAYLNDSCRKYGYRLVELKIEKC